jgi:hypothetical protein
VRAASKPAADICFNASSIRLISAPLKTISPPITAIINQIATNPFHGSGCSCSLWLRHYCLRIRGSAISLLPKTAALDCVKQILIYTNSPDAPALFGGIASTNLERLKLFLDYSAYFTGLADAGWSPSRRIELAAFEPFEKDIRYEAIVVSRTSKTLKWGNRPGDKDIIGSGKYRARLAFAAFGSPGCRTFHIVLTSIGNFLDYRPGAITDFCRDTCLNRIDLPQPAKSAALEIEPCRGGLRQRGLPPNAQRPRQPFSDPEVSEKLID